MAPSLLLPLALLTPLADSDLDTASDVHGRLAATPALIKTVLPPGGAVVLVVGLDAARALVSVRVSRTFGGSVATAPLIAAIPMAAAAAPVDSACLIRLAHAGAGAPPSLSVACWVAEGRVELAGFGDAESDAAASTDLTAKLFSAVALDAAGSTPRARAAYRRVRDEAADWDGAALAMGAFLCRAGDLDAAEPHLGLWEKVQGPSDLLRRLRGESVVAAKTAGKPLLAGKVVDGRATVSECLRDRRTLNAYVEAHFEGLRTCMQKEQVSRPKLEFPERLPLSFSVRPSGAIDAVAIGHRFFREGSLLDCVRAALSEPMPAHEGGDCAAAFDFAVQKVRYTDEIEY